jgi:hypothetical protein
MGLKNGKNGRISADAQRQSENGHRCESGGLAHSAQSKTNVLANIHWVVSWGGMSYSFRRKQAGIVSVYFAEPASILLAGKDNAPAVPKLY